MTGMQ